MVFIEVFSSSGRLIDRLWDMVFFTQRVDQTGEDDDWLITAILSPSDPRWSCSRSRRLGWSVFQGDQAQVVGNASGPASAGGVRGDVAKRLREDGDRLARVACFNDRLLTAGDGLQRERLLVASNRRHVAAAFDHFEAFAALGVPHPHGVVVRPAGDPPTVGGKHHAIYRFFMPAEDGQFRPTVRVPHPHGLVVRAAGDPRPVRREGHAHHPALMPLEAGQLRAAAGVPYPNGLVV